MGGDWENVGPALQAASPSWSQSIVDLTAYRGQTIQIGFHFVADDLNLGSDGPALGWYIDDVSVTGL